MKKISIFEDDVVDQEVQERLFKPTGSQLKYDAMVRKCVMGDSTLELALLLGLSSVVSSMRSYLLPSQVFHFSGLKMTGGETALRLALSTFGAPTEKGLIYSMEKGEQELMDDWKEKPWLPIGVSDVEGAHDFFYQQDGTNPDVVPYLYGKTCLSIGNERELPFQVKKDRVIELKNVEWGRDSGAIYRIDEVIRENYAHMGPRLLQFIRSRFSPQEIDLRCDQKSALVRDFIGDSIYSNIAKWNAIIATAEIVEECFDLDFSILNLLQLIQKIQRKGEE